MINLMSKIVGAVAFIAVALPLCVQLVSFVLFTVSGGRYGAVRPTYISRRLLAYIFMGVSAVAMAHFFLSETFSPAVQVCSYVVGWYDYLRLFAFAYFVGALPVGWLIARWQGIEDIRQYGSGGTGATNVSRALGKKWFFVVWLIDLVKAWAVAHFVLELQACSPIALFALVLLFLGNLYSVFLGFTGGKGVSTGLGILFAINVYLALMCCAVWSIVLYVTRTVGIASVATVVALPCIAWYLQIAGSLLLFVSFMTFFILLKHCSNIRQYCGLPAR